MFKERIKMFIFLFLFPKFLQREAEHIDGFAKECAVVTHSRLKQIKMEFYNLQVNWMSL